jgi:hypothetical protein
MIFFIEKCKPLALVLLGGVVGVLGCQWVAVPRGDKYRRQPRPGIFLRKIFSKKSQKME